MARYLILPLVLLLALVGLLFFVGDDQWVQLELLPQAVDTKPANGFAMSLQFGILALIAAIAGIIGLWSLLGWMWRLPRRVKTGFGRKREIHGLEAVEKALLAGEAGDGEDARKHAKRAHDLLQRPALTDLVSARAAEASGEINNARTHYTALLDNPKTQTAGLRGLSRLAEKQGDLTAAIDMAKKAYEQPKGPAWAFDLLFRSQVSLLDWGGAIESLKMAEKRKHVSKDKARRLRSVLYTAKAAKLEKDGKIEGAIDASLKAADQNPEFAPGTALAARLLSHNGQVKKAMSLLEKAWSKAPHPALSLAYSDLFSTEPDKVRTKKINSLIKSNPAHRESFILAAEEALRSNDGVAALTALGSLLRDEDPSARLCALASTAEDRLNNPIDAKAWSHRAASAPVEADWSDLDPDGPAFAYTNEDWQRLVISYGETGTLIHPRYESRKRRKSVFTVDDNTSPPNQDIRPPTPDDPGITLEGKDAKDLSDRLENLLDTNK